MPLKNAHSNSRTDFVHLYYYCISMVIFPVARSAVLSTWLDLLSHFCGSVRMFWVVYQR
jgi:hypothetical protein